LGGSREKGAPRQWALDSNHKNQKIVYDRHYHHLNSGNASGRKL